jgi:hypothetical protein
VDPGKPDAYGIPIPVIHFRWSANDLAVWKDMREKSAEMMHAAKATMVAGDGAPGGFASHETGTARMGTHTKASGRESQRQSHRFRRHLQIATKYLMTTGCWPSQSSEGCITSMHCKNLPRSTGRIICAFHALRALHRDKRKIYL